MIKLNAYDLHRILPGKFKQKTNNKKNYEYFEHLGLKEYDGYIHSMICKAEKLITAAPLNMQVWERP